MITKEQALECLEDMDDYARMAMGVDPYGPYNALKVFIELHYQDSLRWKKARELNLDIGTLHTSYEGSALDGAWFEYYDEESLDDIIIQESFDETETKG